MARAPNRKRTLAALLEHLSVVIETAALAAAATRRGDTATLDGRIGQMRIAVLDAIKLHNEAEYSADTSQVNQ